MSERYTVEELREIVRTPFNDFMRSTMDSEEAAEMLKFQFGYSEEKIEDLKWGVDSPV